MVKSNYDVHVRDEKRAVFFFSGAVSRVLTLLSALNEASSEGALVDSLNIFLQMRITNGRESAKRRGWDVEG